MTEITTVGLDLAKSWFQVHGADAQGRPLLRKKLARGKLLAFFAGLPPCLIGMEACGSAHHWARELIKLGHEVRLIPPQYVKPYVKGNKHDAADAEAIGEAVTRPTMRFVPVKTIEQQTMCQLHRIRQLLVKQKTMHVNALRGHLAELGIIRARGLNKVSELMRLIEDAADDGLPAKIRGQLRHLVEPLRDLHHRLAEIDRELGELAREHPAARRLATIPGVGPVTATALAAVIGDIGRFRSGRHLAAYLGLVPMQHSSGGKERLGATSAATGRTRRGSCAPPAQRGDDVQLVGGHALGMPEFWTIAGKAGAGTIFTGRRDTGLGAATAASGGRPARARGRAGARQPGGLRRGRGLGPGGRARRQPGPGCGDQGAARGPVRDRAGVDRVRRQGRPRGRRLAVAGVARQRSSTSCSRPPLARIN